MSTSSNLFILFLMLFVSFYLYLDILFGTDEPDPLLSRKQGLVEYQNNNILVDYGTIKYSTTLDCEQGIVVKLPEDFAVTEITLNNSVNIDIDCFRGEK